MSTRDADFDGLIDALQARIAALERCVAKNPLSAPSRHVFAELHDTLEELHVADEELHQQHEALAVAHETAEFERQRYRELFDLAPDGYVVTDRLGVIREANRAAATMLALPQERLTGTPLVLFMPGDERQRFYTRLQKLRQDFHRQIWEVSIQAWKGSCFAAEVTVAPACDATGNLVDLRWLLHDITSRRQAKTLQVANDNLERRVLERTASLRQMNEQLLAEVVERRRVEGALRESEQRFRAVFDQAAVGIAVLDVDGTWRQANQRFCEFVGYTAGELYKQPWQRTTHPDDLAAGVDYTRRLLAGEVLVYTWEKRYLPKEGTPIWGKVTASLVRDATGAPKYFIHVVEDIMARKRAEAQAEQAQHALRRSREHLRQLTAHLQNTQEQERARIARELHDDLAQSLTGLRLDASWLAKQLAAAPAAWKQRVQSMRHQVEDLKTAVQRIGTELRPTMLDDLGLFAAIEWQLQQTCRRAGLRYTLHLPDEDDVLLDPACATALFRICQEALTNVVRHAAANSVTVQIIVQHETLLLEVTDNGKGFLSEHVLERDALGLLGMRERATLWGGDVTIHSLPGKGTTITVRMPYPPLAGETYDSCADRR